MSNAVSPIATPANNVISLGVNIEAARGQYVVAPKESSIFLDFTNQIYVIRTDYWKPQTIYFDFALDFYYIRDVNFNVKTRYLI